MLKVHNLQAYKKANRIKQFIILPKKAGYQGTSPWFAIAQFIDGREVLCSAQNADWKDKDVLANAQVFEDTDPDTGEVRLCVCGPTAQRTIEATL